jgi:mRNA-degrading endonuclease RelE of RelBE toxin-antitoxin system
MSARRPFEIVYDPRVKEHLASVERKYHGLIRRTIDEQLTCEPETETRNRKPLLREVVFDADWELRFGPDNRFRVLYAVDEDQHVVEVLAIGVKRGSRLFIAGEEVKL